MDKILNDNCLQLILLYMPPIKIFVLRTLSKKFYKICTKILPIDFLKLPWFKSYIKYLYNYNLEPKYITYNKNEGSCYDISDYNQKPKWMVLILFNAAEFGDANIFYRIQHDYFPYEEFTINYLTRCLTYAIKSKNNFLFQSLITLIEQRKLIHNVDWNIRRSFLETIYTNNITIASFIIDNYQIDNLSGAKIIAEIYGRTNIVDLIKI